MNWNRSYELISNFPLTYAIANLCNYRTPNVTLPVLPPKKFFGNTDKSFVNDRKVALQVSLSVGTVFKILTPLSIEIF